MDIGTRGPGHWLLHCHAAADQEAKQGSMLPQPSAPIDLQPLKLLNGTNGVSLTKGTSAVHMPGSFEHLQAVNSATSVGNGIGPGTSASWRHKYTLAILCFHQLTFIVSGTGTRPSAHTVKALKKQLNIWCSNVWPTIRPGGTCGQETAFQQTRDTWSYLERIGAMTHPLSLGMRERETTAITITYACL